MSVSSVVQRVVITGPESTGKTWLAEQLAAHYQTVWVPEYARTYVDEKQARDPASPLCEYADLVAIAKEHRACELQALPHAHRFLISDTDALSTVVYAKHYFNDVPPAVLAIAETWPARLWLLLDVDVPWVPDSQRDRPHQRRELWDLFAAELRDRQLPFTTIMGSWKERFSKALAAINLLETS